MYNLNKRHILLGPSERLYSCDVPIIGLTGGIATGKSTVAKYLQQKSFNLLDADVLIKSIYQQENTINFIKNLLPDVIENNHIAFTRLREKFFSNNAVKKKIEQYLYAKLEAEFAKEYSQLQWQNSDFLIYDVPLLFEKNLTAKFDLILLVYSSPQEQIQRIVERDNCSTETAENILAAQIPIDEKRNLAHYIIENNSHREDLYSRIDSAINFLCE